MNKKIVVLVVLLGIYGLSFTSKVASRQNVVRDQQYLPNPKNMEVEHENDALVETDNNKYPTLNGEEEAEEEEYSKVNAQFGVEIARDSDANKEHERAETDRKLKLDKTNDDNEGCEKDQANKYKDANQEKYEEKEETNMIRKEEWDQENKDDEAKKDLGQNKAEQEEQEDQGIDNKDASMTHKLRSEGEENYESQYNNGGLNPEKQDDSKVSTINQPESKNECEEELRLDREERSYENTNSECINEEPELKSNGAEEREGDKKEGNESMVKGMVSEGRNEEIELKSDGAEEKKGGKKEGNESMIENMEDNSNNEVASHSVAVSSRNLRSVKENCDGSVDNNEKLKGYSYGYEENTKFLAEKKAKSNNRSI